MQHVRGNELVSRFLIWRNICPLFPSNYLLKIKNMPFLFFLLLSSECEPDYNTCMFCNQDFCADCKGGSFFASSCRQGCGWACVDCLQRANSTSRSKTNEEEDSCANCFISEDDMDNVNLKQCAGCRTVKYCSRSCQKADWKEHRNICKAVVAAAAASDDNDVEEETKGEN